MAAAEPTGTARVVAAWPALAFAVAFELLLQQRRVQVADPVDVLPVEVVVPVVESSPTSHPVGDSPLEPVAQPVEPVESVGEAPVEVAEPVVETDPLNARLTELLSAARTGGRPVGRRTVARELGVSEYRAGRLLARTNNNGMGGTR